MRVLKVELVEMPVSSTFVFVCVHFFRWEEYGTVGKPVAGTRFISFKVPLKEVSLYCV